jgi:hypothetical protein
LSSSSSFVLVLPLPALQRGDRELDIRIEVLKRARMVVPSTEAMTTQMAYIAATRRSLFYKVSVEPWDEPDLSQPTVAAQYTKVKTSWRRNSCVCCCFLWSFSVASFRSSFHHTLLLSSSPSPPLSLLYPGIHDRSSSADQSLGRNYCQHP